MWMVMLPTFSDKCKVSFGPANVEQQTRIFPGVVSLNLTKSNFGDWLPSVEGEILIRLYDDRVCRGRDKENDMDYVGGGGVRWWSDWELVSEEGKSDDRHLRKKWCVYWSYQSGIFEFSKFHHYIAEACSLLRRCSEVSKREWLVANCPEKIVVPHFHTHPISHVNT